MKFLLSTLTMLIMLSAIPPLTAQTYTISSDFGNLTECDTMSRDMFLFWWDNDIDQSAEVDVLLDSLIIFKDIFLNTYNMQQPDAPTAGHFINIYVFRDGDSSDLFVNEGWGNGVGGDSNGFSFWTVPSGILGDFVNAAHESCHIFQFNGTSLGFDQDDGEWFYEASAEWFAVTHYPDYFESHITSRCLTRLPHVPLWLGWANYPASYPQNWQREGHQYGLATYLYYLTEVAGVPRSIIMSSFFANTNLTAQEYLYNQIGGTTFRQDFIDCAVHMTNNFDFILPSQSTNAENEWNNVADPNDINEFTAIFNDAGTSGWFRPADDKVTNAWSFNTYKLNNTQNETYTFELKGDAAGNLGDAAHFQAKLLVKNTNTGASFYDVNMSDALNGSFNITLSSSDTEVYMIVASMPEYFQDATPTVFQLFPYEIQITKGTTANPNISADNSCIQIFPCPANNFFTLQGDLSSYTIDIINSSGSVIQTINASGTEATIDISTLPVGTHILRMINLTNNQLHIEQIIKQ